MKRLFICLIILVATSYLQLNAQTDSLTISVVTCEKGKEIYTWWGHSALRVNNHTKQQDAIFNFGMFDFSTPNFVGKFIKGNLQYFLGVQYTQDFFEHYRENGMGVTEQVLNLSPEEKQQIFDRLLYLYRPENRYYCYKFASDNCTTAVRDLILNLIKTDYTEKKCKVTTRKLLHHNIEDHRWLQLGIDLLLGRSVDKKVNTTQYMFLPDNLMEQLGKLKKANGEPLVLQANYHKPNPDKVPHPKTPLFSDPLFIAIILLVITVLITRFTPNKWADIFTRVIIGITTLGSLILLVMALFSQHAEVLHNWNILWINPLFAILLFAPANSKIGIITSYIINTCLAVTIVLWVCRVQYTCLTFYVIAFILAQILYYRQKIYEGHDSSSKLEVSTHTKK